MSNDPLEERRLRLEQAEREAKGDFSQPAPKPPAPVDKTIRDGAEWAKYDPKNNDDLDQNPNAILNRQHNNLRAQAKITLGLAAMLDTTTQPREER